MSTYQAWPFLSDASQPLLSALWSVAIHALLSLVVLAPLLARSAHRVRDGALAAAVNVAFDFDHVIAARSFSLHTIETMWDRPVTHSLLFVLLLTAAVSLLSRRPILAWSVFAVLSSHLLFDGAGGSERLLYPFSGIDGIPWLLFPLGLAVLTFVSAVLARRLRTPLGARRPVGAPAREAA